MTLKDKILADKDFPRQPRGLADSVKETGFESLLTLPWRGETAILRYDFVNDNGEKMFWFFYFDSVVSEGNLDGHLIAGTQFI